METENLTKALHSIEFFCDEMREAHKDALTSGNRFEADLFDLMQEGLKLEMKLRVIQEVANAVDKKGKSK